MKMAWWLLPALLSGLAGCGDTRIGRFAGGQPSMAPELWMTGTVDGYGVIFDRFGTVKSQFHAHEMGSWSPSTATLTLRETISYLQGDRQGPTDRTWRFVETAPGRWTGTAGDVIGTAAGEQQGNAWHLRFRQLLPVGGRRIAVTVDDWRFREAPDVAVDRSTISKLGIGLATAVIAFVKAE